MTTVCGISRLRCSQRHDLSLTWHTSQLGLAAFCISLVRRPSDVLEHAPSAHLVRKWIPIAPQSLSARMVRTPHLQFSTIFKYSLCMLIYATPASLLDPLSTVPVAPTCFQGICRLARNHSVWLSTSPMWLPLVLGRIWLPPFKVTHTAEKVAFWAGPHMEISSACIGKTFASQSRPFSLYCASWYFWSLGMQHRPAALLECAPMPV